MNAGGAQHFIVYYNCGHVASQCRCPATDKFRKTLVEKCGECKAKEQAAAKAEA